VHLADQFDRAAVRYDLLTRLNPGYHAALAKGARAVCDRVRAGDRSPGPLALWDLGCGSGLSTRALVEAAGEDLRVVGVDASRGMLDRAREKAWPAGVRFVHARAQELARVAHEVGLQDGSADGVFAAYLLRNVPAEQRDAVLEGILVQLRPGGWLVLQDYHVAGNPLAQAVWSGVCWGVVTPLAVALRGHPAIYRYLWRSVLDNDSVEDLTGRLTRAGFEEVSSSTASGWQRGILHTVVARRPESDRA
jgi:ubiquinone/menaquinone biosynthesis C-methylase UbiE